MTLRADKLSFSYGRGSVLENLDIAIYRKHVTSVVGPNGIGKSTLLRCLANVYQPTKGVVYLDGKSLVSLSPRELAKSFGYVPQHQSDVFSVTVYEAILLGRKPYMSWRVRKEDTDIVDILIKRFRLESMATRSINTLSGGERQRVALARALAQEPSVLFLDEPTSSLDMNHQLDLMSVVRELAKDDGRTVVMVMNDLNLAGRFSDQMAILGPKGSCLLGEPQSVLTRENIGAVYGVEVEVLKTAYGPFILPIRRLDEVS